jgi:Cysteine-rich CPXCG
MGSGSAGVEVSEVVEGKMRDEASYNCDSCGEEIVVPIDLTAGSRQEYVEDCPVCCCPNVIHVEVDDDGDVRVWAQRE